LAGSGCWCNSVPVAGHDLYDPFAQTSLAGHHLWSGKEMNEFINGLLRLRRSSWEMVASILIAAGVLMLMQPIALWLYTYSFLVALLGTIMFIIVSHFPE
jgi:hypothetical protein